MICEICNKRFKTIKGLSNHISTLHKDIVIRKLIACQNLRYLIFLVVYLDNDNVFYSSNIDEIKNFISSQGVS